MAEFNFSCPYCGQYMQAQTEWDGQQTQCPYCKKIITITATQHKITRTIKTETFTTSNERSIKKDTNQLIKCRVCGHSIYSKAATCTECGAVTRYCQSHKAIIFASFAFFLLAAVSWGIAHSITYSANEKIKDAVEEVKTAQHLRTLAITKTEREYEEAESNLSKARKELREAEDEYRNAGEIPMITRNVLAVIGFLSFLAYAMQSFYYHWWRF